MARRLTSLLPFALLAVLVSGCLGATQRRQDALTRQARELTDGLRWGRYDQIAAFLPEDEVKGLMARAADAGDDLVVADGEVTMIQVEPGADKATVVAEFTWYNQRRALVRKTTVEQSWEWTGTKWLMAKQRRVRGDRFPLVPEPLASASPNPPQAAPPQAAPPQAVPPYPLD